MIASAVAWILTLAIHVVFIIDFDLFLAINNPLLITFVVVIVLCNVTVYRETRRHEQQIADQQVSVEARKKFLGAKTSPQTNRYYCCTWDFKLFTCS